MKKVFLFILLCFIETSLMGQGIDNLWMMGDFSFSGGPPYGGININFSTGQPIISYIERPMFFGTTSVAQCDTNGNILFYSNGVYIADANDDTMMNGSGLSPSYYTSQVGWDGLYVPQAALILPSPTVTSKYFIFHGTIDDSVSYAYRIYYSEVDMNLNGGLGVVTSKNNILLNDTLICGRITSVRHGNGRDWWLVFHKGHSDLYYIYLVDPSGIHFHSSQNIGSNLISVQGQCCFSPDGSKFAIYDPIDDLDVLDFDRCSGQFSSPIHVSINDTAAGGGVAFSPSSKVLYVSSTKYVYQFDLMSANIAASKITVATWDGFYSPSSPAATTFYLSQLAPDGKIYISCTNSTVDIHVINYPDTVGLGCAVCQHCVHLPAFDSFTMPNYPNYFLGALTGSACDSLVSGIQNATTLQNAIRIFPNPVHGLMYIPLNQSLKIKTVKVFNTIGEEMPVNISFVRNVEYLELNTSSLSQGIYFLELNCDKEKIVKRFAKD